jgi:hypothetical protein
MHTTEGTKDDLYIDPAPPIIVPHVTVPPAPTVPVHKVRSGSGLSVRGTSMPPPTVESPESLSLAELKQRFNASVKERGE